MAKKARKKGGQATRAQQQQEAAAKRRLVRDSGSSAPTAQPAAASGPVPPQRTRVRHYLDVSAVRIQDWLARTPDLRFRRGASVLLTEATARDAWESALPPGMRWNDEAGSVDGVVALVVEESVAESDVAGRVGDAARAVARRMRNVMPYCPVQAVTGSGESYAAAYQDMLRAREDGDFLIDDPPAPPEVILAKPCDQCRSAAAAHQRVMIVPGENRDLCRDCHQRFEAAGGTKGDWLRRSPLPERRMRDALSRSGTRVTGFPDNFRQMAEAGRLGGDDAATQLALVYADGNNVGAFLSEAARHARDGGGPARTDIVPVLDRATLDALADAIADRFRGWSRPPVLANLAGGDDLLISVPAPDAWLFTTTLIRAFGTHIAEAAAGWPRPVREQLPSLSAGLVFHHLAAPFSDLVRIAEDQLDRAKEAGRGAQPAVAFLDLTADGGVTPAGREPVTLAYLDGQAGRLARIEQIPRSRRETLVTLLRQDASGEFIRRLTDLDNGPLWEAVAGPGADGDAARNELTGHPDKLSELRRLLDLARYWHTAPRPEPAAAGLRQAVPA